MTEKTTFLVSRFCCTSGLCLVCRASGDLKRRKRIDHADGLTEERAKKIAAAWKGFGASVEERANVPGLRSLLSPKTRATAEGSPLPRLCGEVFVPEGGGIRFCARVFGHAGSHGEQAPRKVRR